MKIIAICGGVASGKNVICEIFKKKGAKIFDADAIVHELLDKNKVTNMKYRYVRENKLF